jgi:hypothetical protein
MATQAIHQAVVKTKYRTADLPVEFIKDILDYDPETGILTWRANPTSRRKSRYAGQQAGTITPSGYVDISVKPGVVCRAHRIAWTIIHGEWPTHDIDHENGIRSDNRLSNLRRATGNLNAANKAMQRNNTSGYVGVDFNRQNGMWRARAKRGMARYNMGYFASAQAAHEAREKFLRALKDTHGPNDPHRAKYRHHRDRENH